MVFYRKRIGGIALDEGLKPKGPKMRRSTIWDLLNPSFEKLPLELRQKVYHYIVADGPGDMLIKVALNDTYFMSQSLRNAAGAIFVNKAMSNELLDYVFGQFTFSISDIAPSSNSLLSKFCVLVGSKNAKLIKKIIIPHLLPHDAQALKWGNPLGPSGDFYEFPTLPTYRIGNPYRYNWVIAEYRHTMNRLEELQKKSVLSRMPALRDISLGMDAGSILGRFIKKRPKASHTGVFQLPEITKIDVSMAQLSEMAPPHHECVMDLVLWWFLVELSARNIHLGIFWTDIHWYSLRRFKSATFGIDLTGDKLKNVKQYIIDVLQNLPTYQNSWKTSGCVTDLGRLPDDLFAYGISQDYFRGSRPHLYWHASTHQNAT